MRIFDILACGGFVLAEYTEALEELFIMNEEIVCWRSASELREKAGYYLQHPEEARAIALAGRARVCRDHRIKDRVHGMLRVLLESRETPRSLSLAG
jgi:spore maturation protein CgeB